eukprot:Blabericola_migrator_1__7878@NODE_402_length_8862_cov_53_826265_g319_i0_p4_GENE_NODE_402_length_8862_cov_53_826265_g319_i0NODE_402_length_8862_cov_53_826265_g319_i0_p4_ORF_typecomplete_len223_score36_01_NODE_402_length_8862_cov_53_826265_g319_i065537221
MLLEDAASILVDVEKLDTFLIAANTDLIVSCRLGNKTLRSAVGEWQANMIAFDTLLHFPFTSEEDTDLNFSLQENSSETELGRCELSLKVFDGHKTAKSVRIKLKSGEEEGIGFLELKVKLSDIMVTKASSAKYFRSPRPLRISMTKVEDFESRVQSLCFLIYSLADIPYAVPGKFILSAHFGTSSLSVSELTLQQNARNNNFYVPIDRSFTFPYDGFQYIR